ncbi:TetR family transcriptional regulator, partial [Romboutsia timonensis]|uniref:TetR family transcriptional regulator n=1 Tax=Romboutsia timonensis TaxID=1776391 RepID=UPI002A825AE2
MKTKDKILIEALSLFSVSGFSGVSVRDIAKAVGIRESAIYKHYKNKQELFDTIVEVSAGRIDSLQEELISKFNHNVNTKEVFPISIIQEIYCNIFLFYLTDDVLSKFRRMMTIEHLKDNELNRKFKDMFIEKTLSYQSEVFRNLINEGKVNGTNPDIMAIHFYSPIFMLFFRYDSEDDKIDEAL